MANTHTTLNDLFADIADAIRNKTGSTAGIKADEFPTAIANIPKGSGNAQAGDVLSGKTFTNSSGAQTGTIPIVAGKTVTPSKSAQTAVSAGSYCSGNITVAAMSPSYTATTLYNTTIQADWHTLSYTLTADYDMIFASCCTGNDGNYLGTSVSCSTGTQLSNIGNSIAQNERASENHMGIWINCKKGGVVKFVNNYGAKVALCVGLTLK